MPSISEIAAYLEAEAALEYPGECNPDTFISGPAVSGSAGSNTLIFLGMTVRDPVSVLRGAQAGLAIVDGHLREKCREAVSGGIVKAVIWSNNPRLDFCRVLERFFAPPRPEG